MIALGLVSLCMDTSSELIHGLLPVFLVVGLGASPIMLGVIEGLAEATASLTRLFSGTLSDRLARRKPLVLAGYGLAALSKPLFPMATSATTVFFARFVDRIGKGVRGAPRDALVADLTPPAQRGAAFGLRQSLDMVGAVGGPLLAIGLMQVFAGDVRAVMWVAVIPAAVAVALIAWGVPESPAHASPDGAHEASPDGSSRAAPDEASATGPAAHREELARLPPLYWLALTVAVLLTLARFSEAFLLLRASDLGLGETMVPAILVVMNVVYALSAYPVGVWSDRIGRGRLLALGITLLVAADGVLALAGSPWGVAFGAALWGLHLGATQGLLATLVADTAPASLRGSAFGLQHFASGLATLVASVLAGGLWSGVGPEATFLMGGLLASVALGVLLWMGRRLRAHA